MARGAYLRDLGNTPGHVNHWSKRAFVSLLSRHGRSRRPARRSRGPCCLSALAERRLRPRRPPSSRWGSASPGSSPTRTSRSPRTRSGATTADLAALVGDLHRRLGALPAGRAAALAHDRRPRRPRRSRERTTCGSPRRSSSRWRCSSRSPRSRCASPIQDDLFGGSAALYWVWCRRAGLRGELLRPRLPRRHHRFGLYGRLVLMEAARASCSRWPSPSGITKGRRRWRWGWRRRRSSRWRWCRGRSRRPPPRRTSAGAPEASSTPTARSRSRASRSSRSRAARFAVAVLVIMLCEQTFLNAGPLLVKATEAARAARRWRLRLQRAADRPRAAAALPGGPDLDPPHLTRLRPAVRRIRSGARQPHADRDRGLRRRVALAMLVRGRR